MRNVDKAVAAVLRDAGGRRELLAFRHPAAGLQLPRGTVEPGELPAEAVLRELHEESGLLLDVAPLAIGQWTRVLDGSFGEEPTGDRHRWHVYLIEASDLPDGWSHVAVGGAEEDGLALAFQWLALDDSLADRLHPLFTATVALLRDHFAAAQ